MKKIYVVGIGPGNEEFMTFQARNVIENADVICGYTVYVDLVRHMAGDKEIYATGMMKEKDRCKWAIERAAEDKVVALVCSGDAGVYGMASLVLELAQDHAEVEVEIVTGVSAVLSGGAVLGAPVAHDFCVVSLSDHLTEWSLIEKRIRLGGEADFIMVLYNPKSKKRPEYINRACEILMEVKSPDTVCGWVRNIGRDGQEYRLCTLKELPEQPIDMFTTVFIGNSNTVNMNGKMVTPRGYIEKYGK